MHRDENKIYFGHALQKLGELKDGWVSGGRAISKIAIQTTRTILNALPDCDELQHLDVGPFVNGSVFLTYRNGDKHMCLNIAEAGVSAIFYTKINKELESELDTYVDGKFKPHEIDKIVDFIKKGL